MNVVFNDVVLMKGRPRKMSGDSQQCYPRCGDFVSVLVKD